MLSLPESPQGTVECAATMLQPQQDIPGRSRKARALETPKSAYTSGFFDRTGPTRKALPNLQGGGRWFEPSITHSEKAAFCRMNADRIKSLDENLSCIDTTLTLLRAQYPATLGKPQKRNRLRCTAFTIACNTCFLACKEEEEEVAGSIRYRPL
jgi:hypothetical protein